MTEKNAMNSLRDISIVLSQEPRLRKKLRPSDVAWNKNRKAFEYWNGEEWLKIVSVEDNITKKDLDAHKIDPEAHPLATPEKPGFSSSEDKSKLNKLEVTLDPDPTQIFLTALGKN